MNRITPILIRNLAHNRALLDEIKRSGLASSYNTTIVYQACEAIEAELRRRGV